MWSRRLAAFLTNSNSLTTAKIAFAGLIASYPFVVYFGLRYFEARTIAAVLMALTLIRFALLRRTDNWFEKMPQARLVVIVLPVICGLVVLSNSPSFLLYYPVFMSMIMLAIFAGSLFHPPTVIERIARLKTPDLSDKGVRYTRHVTMVWCGFFLINGALAFYTSLAAEMKAWVVYNGFISYAVMGILFVGEYAIRCRLQLNLPKCSKTHRVK